MQAGGQFDISGDAGRPSIFWHCALIVMLLAVVAAFFYLRHQIRQQAEREIEKSAVVFETVPDKLHLGRNVMRWHDSSQIFAAARDFQAANDGNLPENWGNELLDSLYIGESVTTVHDQAGLSLPEMREEEFHVLVGHACAENEAVTKPKMATGVIPVLYVEEVELTYAQIVNKSDDSDFAIVYGMESSSDISKRIRCLDSLGGFDDPAFLFKEDEL